jgi:uncharacterized DUF497 family protein
LDDQGVEYEFEWDPAKAASNLRKHRVAFELAATVFHDRLAVSIVDPEHSGAEERWVTLGQMADGTTVAVSHTFSEETPRRVRIRLISARKATRIERRSYEEDR